MWKSRPSPETGGSPPSKIGFWLSAGLRFVLLGLLFVEMGLLVLAYLWPAPSVTITKDDKVILTGKVRTAAEMKEVLRKVDLAYAMISAKGANKLRIPTQKITLGTNRLLDYRPHPLDAPGPGYREQAGLLSQ